LAAAVRVVRLIVRVVLVVDWADVSAEAGVVALVSRAGADCSVLGGGCVAAGSVVTGCVCCAASWASAEVEESAKAATIAGRALVRA
jgi:xanthine/CO dehydrogenase XdhC/CoxF family maturation factor